MKANGWLMLRKEMVLESSRVQAGEYCLVTGASQGLGRAFAELLAQQGKPLLLAALPESGLAQAADEIASRWKVDVKHLEVDLTEPDGPECLCGWALGLGVPISMLINNAGGGYNSRFDESTLAQNERCILLNNLALVKITRLMLPELQKHGQAHVLNVASLAAFFPMPFMPVYSPAKAFTLNFSLALREEMRYTPVRVSVLCPNGIRTNQECRQKIASAGLAARLTCLDASEVAGYALKKMAEGRAVIVPGVLNQVLMRLGKFTPRAVLCAVVTAFWGRSARSGSAL